MCGVFVGNISYMCEIQPIFRIMLNTLSISSVMWQICSILFAERFDFITRRSAPFCSGSVQCLQRGMIFNDQPPESQGGRGRKRLGRAYMATHYKVVCFMQHFTHLLSSNDPDILLAALQALVALVRINPSKLHLSGKLPGSAVLNLHFLDLSQGWGSK